MSMSESGAGSYAPPESGESGGGSGGDAGGYQAPETPPEEGGADLSGGGYGVPEAPPEEGGGDLSAGGYGAPETPPEEGGGDLGTGDLGVPEGTSGTGGSTFASSVYNVPPVEPAQTVTGGSGGTQTTTETQQPQQTQTTTQEQQQQQPGSTTTVGTLSLQPVEPGTPEPAEIHVYDSPDQTETASKTIACMFRPSQISFTKAASWKAPVTGTEGGGQEPTQQKFNVPTVQFAGGQAATMTLDLLFNTTDTGADVRTYTDELVNLTLATTEGETVNDPPLCRFVWGKVRSFLSYVSSVTVTFKMFLADGTPVRAEAKVTFNQIKDDEVFAKQNPTSFSETRKMWVVKQGERLDWIAHQEYGNPAHWRHIAITNNILDPLDLRPGQVLKLTPLPR